MSFSMLHICIYSGVGKNYLISTIAWDPDYQMEATPIGLWKLTFGAVRNPGWDCVGDPICEHN